MKRGVSSKDLSSWRLAPGWGRTTQVYTLRKDRPTLKEAMTAPTTPLIETAIEEQLDRLVNPGTWFTGGERHAICSAARDGDATSAARRAAQRVSKEPTTITAEWISELAADGLGIEAYVEVVSIASIIRAVDSFDFGVGVPQRALPNPVDGEPSRLRNDDVDLHNAWVPTTGRAVPMNVLSAVPAESAAMNDLLAAMYLIPAFNISEGPTMGNKTAERDGLTRPQMELVASHTSLLNDCFY